jgi:hypothetical protein
MEEGTSIVFQLTSFCVALYHIFKYEQIVDWLPTMLSFSLYSFIRKSFLIVCFQNTKIVDWSDFLFCFVVLQVEVKMDTYVCITLTQNISISKFSAREFLIDIKGVPRS